MNDSCVLPTGLVARALAPGFAFLGAVLLVALTSIASRGAMVPFWDGRVYADCIIGAAQGHLARSTMRCAGHASHAFVLFAGAIQLLAPQSFIPLLIAHTILYLLGVAAVYRLATLAFPADEHTTDRALIAAVFAAQPAVIASVVQPNVDLPLVPAFLWAAVFLVRRNWPAVIALGVVMAFTKETGLLLYMTLVAAYAIAMVLPRPSSPRSPTRTILRLAPLAIPVILFGAYIVYPKPGPDQAGIWHAGSNTALILRLLTPIGPAFVNYLTMMLVLSFAWVITSVLIVDAIVALFRKFARGRPSSLPGSKRRVVRFLVVLGVATMFALTRFSTWGNPRYVLPVFALTPLMLYASILRLSLPPTLRRAGLGLLCILLLIATHRSIDPISRAVYGTFAVGNHDLLRMTGVTGECCGAGRDQLVYNLQFSVLGDLTSDATAALVNESSVIFVPEDTRWSTVGPLDATTHRRTLVRSHSLIPRELEPDTLRFLSTPPGDAVFIALPNGDAAAALRLLTTRYSIGAPLRMRRGDYWLDAYRLTLLGTRPSPIVQ